MKLLKRRLIYIDTIYMYLYVFICILYYINALYSKHLYTINKIVYTQKYNFRIVYLS